MFFSIEVIAMFYRLNGVPSWFNRLVKSQVVVFKCMSPRSPKCFARKEIDTVTRGFISDILLDSTEEVRQEIYEVLHSAGLKSIGPKDFEFIDVNSKTGWRVIKQVAGTGAIYVRLLRHPTMELSDSSEQDA